MLTLAAKSESSDNSGSTYENRNRHRISSLILAFSKRNNKFPATQPNTNAFQQLQPLNYKFLKTLFIRKNFC